MPAGVHSFYLRECYLENKLSQGKLVLDNVRIDLKKVKAPIYNLAAKEDHIAPLPVVFRLGKYFGGETTLVVSGSGHIAGVVNPPAAKKYQYLDQRTLHHVAYRMAQDRNRTCRLMVAALAGMGDGKVGRQDRRSRSGRRRPPGHL